MKVGLKHLETSVVCESLTLTITFIGQVNLCFPVVRPYSLVQRFRSSAKVKYHCNIFPKKKKMAVSRALVFSEHILLNIDQELP